MRRRAWLSARYRRRVVTVLALAGVLVAGCGGADDAEPAAADTDGGAGATPSGPPWFVDEAQQRGIDFQWSSGHDGQSYLQPEVIGGGAALFDMDGDGDLDAYLVQAGSLHLPAADRPGNRLYRNDGSGRFADVTEGSGADDRGYGMGVACGDHDGDGDVDLYVTNVGPNVLLRNDGDGRFTDVSDAAGVGDPAWGSSTAFVDYDVDGDLDLYVANYINWSVNAEQRCYNAMGFVDYCAPIVYQAPSHDVLYRNEGDGTFRDVSVESGIRTISGNGLGVVCADFTGDGIIDIFVANDATPNRLWAGKPDGTFRDVAFMMSCALDTEGKAKAGMGVAATDYDTDGDMDLIVCNLRREADSLFRNDGAHFTDVTRRAVLATSRRYTRFGLGWHDFDHDGYLDLFEANGRVSTEADHPDPDDRFAEPNLLYRGRADGSFEVVEPVGVATGSQVETSRGAAFGDVDGDGRIDVLVVNRDAPARLLRNVAPGAGNWIIFRVVDEGGRDAHHAAVTLRAGDRAMHRAVQPDHSMIASNDPRVHFGLGSAERVEAVAVRWPGGAQERFGGFDANAVVELRQGAGEPVESGGEP